MHGLVWHGIAAENPYDMEWIRTELKARDDDKRKPKDVLVELREGIHRRIRTGLTENNGDGALAASHGRHEVVLSNGTLVLHVQDPSKLFLECPRQDSTMSNILCEVRTFRQILQEKCFQAVPYP